jgi:hypothetical protein
MLAERLADLGLPTDRATVARTETLQRGLSLDDALASAAEVGASPINMMLHTDDGALVAVTPNTHLESYDARQWARGNFELRAEDERTYRTEVPADEWVAFQRRGLNGVVEDTSRLVRAVVEDDGDAIVRLIDQINGQLDMIRREEANPGTR